MKSLNIIAFFVTVIYSVRSATTCSKSDGSTYVIECPEYKAPVPDVNKCELAEDFGCTKIQNKNYPDVIKLGATSEREEVNGRDNYEDNGIKGEEQRLKKTAAMPKNREENINTNSNVNSESNEFSRDSSRNRENFKAPRLQKENPRSHERFQNRRQDVKFDTSSRSGGRRTETRRLNEDERQIRELQKFKDTTKSYNRSPTHEARRHAQRNDEDLNSRRVHTKEHKNLKTRGMETMPTGDERGNDIFQEINSRGLGSQHSENRTPEFQYKRQNVGRNVNKKESNENLRNAEENEHNISDKTKDRKHSQENFNLKKEFLESSRQSVFQREPRKGFMSEDLRTETKDLIENERSGRKEERGTNVHNPRINTRLPGRTARPEKVSPENSKGNLRSENVQEERSGRRITRKTHKRMNQRGSFDERGAKFEQREGRSGENSPFHQ